MSFASSSYLPLAEKACQFLSKSTDPYHAVHQSVLKLQAAGFTELVPNKFTSHGIKPGGQYYYTIHQSTLVAFSVGRKYTPTNSAFQLIGGHTDSPNLRIKPISKRTPSSGCTQLGVQCYGGGLWHTWFDRDLSVSGKVLVRNNNNKEIHHCLVQLQDPIARISTLCIHLQSAEERKAFCVNKEDHTIPIIATTTSTKLGETNPQLEQAAEEQVNVKKPKLNNNNDDDDTDPWLDQQEPLLLHRIAEALQIETNQIADLDLSFYDTQPSAIGGINREFLYSGRLDNLATVFCAITALIDYNANKKEDDNDTDIQMVVCFDHEEVGSTSLNGAGSPVMEQAVRRISAALNGGDTNPELYANAIAKSFCLSIDQAHAVHPNYASKHEKQHAPVLNGGLVIKRNANQRYATNSETGFLVRELGRKAKIPIQEFVVRNDCPCGSTIGPTISALTGIRTVDAGMPQLSMHRYESSLRR